jgi:hypothetical protein
MLKIIASALCLIMPCQGAFKRANLSLSLDHVKQGTDLNGLPNLNVIAKLNAGNIVTFKLPDKIVTGRVTKVEVNENEYIKIVGIFDKEESAGFAFLFSATEGKIEGGLSFNGGNLQYNLKFNTINNFFYFERNLFNKLDKL